MSDIDENWHCEAESLVNLFSFGWTEGALFHNLGLVVIV